VLPYRSHTRRVHSAISREFPRVLWPSVISRLRDERSDRSADQFLLWFLLVHV